MKRTVQTRDTRIIDENGIERVITSEKVITHNTDVNPFYMTFINYVGWMYDLKSDTAKDVLFRMMELAEFNTGKVSLSPGERRRIIERLEISRVALYKAINKLISVGAISKVYSTNKNTGEVFEAKGEYMINPEMFWKGELNKRGKLVVTFKSMSDDSPSSNGPVWEQTSTAYGMQICDDQVK